MNKFKINILSSILADFFTFCGATLLHSISYWTIPPPPGRILLFFTQYYYNTTDSITDHRSPPPSISSIKPLSQWNIMEIYTLSKFLVIRVLTILMRDLIN